MIDVALTCEEGEEREALYFAIANHMKKCYLNWNKDTVEDKVIFKHLKELSHKKIDLTESTETLSEVKELMRKRKPTNKNRQNDSRKKSNKYKN